MLDSSPSSLRSQRRPTAYSHLVTPVGTACAACCTICGCWRVWQTWRTRYGRRALVTSPPRVVICPACVNADGRQVLNYVVWDVGLGVLGTAATLTAASDFAHHKRVKNVASGVLDEDATVSHAEMIEHSFYQVRGVVCGWLFVREWSQVGRQLFLDLKVGVVVGTGHPRLTRATQVHHVTQTWLCVHACVCVCVCVCVPRCRCHAFVWGDRSSTSCKRCSCEQWWRASRGRRRPRCAS